MYSISVWINFNPEVLYEWNEWNRAYLVSSNRKLKAALFIAGQRADAMQDNC